MELRTQLGVLRSRYKLMITIIVLACLAAVIASMASPKVYESRATMLVGQSLTAVNPDLNQLAASQQLSTTYAEVAKTGPILLRVIAKLGLVVDPDGLRRQITVEGSPDSALIDIKVRDGDSNRAAAIANALAAEMIAFSPTVEGAGSGVQDFVNRDLVTIQGQIEDTQAEVDRLNGLASPSPAENLQLQALQSRLITLRSTYASMLTYATNSATNHLAVIEPATAPASPSTPSPWVNLVLALAAGTLVALAIAFVLEHLEDLVKTREDAERVTGLPVLGLIPTMHQPDRRNPIYGMTTILHPRSPVSEAFRALRTNVEFTAVTAPLHTIMVTSAQQLEGKSTVAANLAVVFAQTGKRTILVDADLRVPSVHRMFAMHGGKGLTDLMLGSDIDVDDVAQPTEQPGLRIISGGSPAPNPAELIGSDRMRTIIARLVEASDVVIFDCAPINLVTDPAVLSTRVDGTILVIDARHTRSDAAEAARDALALVGARVLGVTLNRLPAVSAEEAYGYYGTTDAAAASSPAIRDAEGRPIAKGATR